MTDELKDIFKDLPPSLVSVEDKLKRPFSAPAPYIQHIPRLVDDAQNYFIKICVDEDVLSRDYLNQKINRFGIVGRILDDSGNRILYSIWNRFMCIDEHYREWTQPHYAIYSSKYENESECINNHPIYKAYFRDKKIDEIIK